MITEAQFNRGTLDCLTALRRRIKQDLGVTIRLAEPDAVERMLALSTASDSDEMRELGARLSGLIAPPSPVENDVLLAQGAIASRQYQPRAARVTEASAERAAASTSVRIYRGQVIRG